MTPVQLELPFPRFSSCRDHLEGWMRELLDRAVMFGTGVGSVTLTGTRPNFIIADDFFQTVRAEGLEPPCHEAAGPKPAVSTSSTTPAPAPEPVAHECHEGNHGRCWWCELGRKCPESVPKIVPTVPVECPADGLDWWYYAIGSTAYETARRI